jgi:LacI family repressor for deo operon, udp, cdd, tsx, nupC, and nupG
VVLDALSSRSVDGVLIFTLRPPMEGVYTALQGKAVLVDAASDALPSLLLDIEAGMHAAMEHLLHLSHTKIAHLAAAVDADTFHRRCTAYLDALSAAELPVTAAYQGRASFTIDDARQAARRILEGASPPSAIVCDSDVLAVGVYKAAKDLHRKIPEDRSVVGFDDSIIARQLDPELTTIAIPTIIGEQAFQLLLAVLEKGLMPAQATIPLELVIRASTTGVKTGEKTC